MKALAAVAVVLMAWGCGPGGEGGSGPPQVGGLAPEFSATTLEGDSVAISDFRGEPLLVNLWATWCGPCRTETPYLQSVHERFGPRGLRTIGITVDGRNALGDVEDFLEEMGVTYTILHDPRMRSMDVFSVIGLPATYVVDAEGRIRFVRQGPVMEGDAAFEEALESVVGGEA